MIPAEVRVVQVPGVAVMATREEQQAVPTPLSLRSQPTMPMPLLQARGAEILDLPQGVVRVVMAGWEGIIVVMEGKHRHLANITLLDMGRGV